MAASGAKELNLVAQDTTAYGMDLYGRLALPELLKQGNAAQALTANPTPLIVVAVIYLVILWPLVRILGRLEQRRTTGRA